MDVDDPHRPAVAAGRPRRPPSARALGRVAAAAALAAVLVTGIAFTGEMLAEGSADGFGVVFVEGFWVLAAALVFGIVLPAWLGSRWYRRVLALCCLAGFGGTLHWLSYEPGDAAGYAVGGAVALLLAAATAAAVLAERAR